VQRRLARPINRNHAARNWASDKHSLNKYTDPRMKVIAADGRMPSARRKETTMQNRLMEVVEKATLKATVPTFEIGDTVDVHVRILEGDKERIQIYNGVVIARSGSGPREMFVVRRIVQGEGVERKFPLHSPRIADIVVKRSGKVRRAKLYYLRQRSGKAVRLKERFTSTSTPAEAKAAKAERRKARAAKKEKTKAAAT
jgi:large subunit ribosomal protein L19